MMGFCLERITVCSSNKAFQSTSAVCCFVLAAGVGWFLLQSPLLAQESNAPAGGASAQAFLAQAGEAVAGSAGARSISFTGTATLVVRATVCR